MNMHIFSRYLRNLLKISEIWGPISKKMNNRGGGGGGGGIIRDSRARMDGTEERASKRTPV